ncbi:MAG: hypothetical protein ABIP12_06130 [Terriglobales bacterium]
MVPGKSRSSSSTRQRPFYEYSSTPAIARIKADGHVADIRQDTTANPTIFHCVVQPVDSREVLFFAQSYTMEEAEEMALQFIRERKGETA